MIKKIHYCWFGGKPLPKSAKKCIASWKKFLPDYEIIEWNEKNFDINQCTFVKEAYENKKWAFISDYARIYALYNHGGIYFDTDLKILKDVSHIVDKKMFLGYEDAAFCGTAVIGTNEVKNKYIGEVLDFYNKIDHFNIEIIYNYANPRIITKMVNQYEKKVDNNGITIVNDDDIYIYPQDYFYPIKFDYSEKNYTKNTCMVHLFNATWIGKRDKRFVKINQKFGPKLGRRLNKLVDMLENMQEKGHMFILKLYHQIKLKISIHFLINRRVSRISNILKDMPNNYIVISNPDDMDDMELANNLFKGNVLELRQQYTTKEAGKIANLLNKKGIGLIIANSYVDGWEKLFHALKEINPQITIKEIMKNNSDIVSVGNEWKLFENTVNMYNKRLIDEIGVFTNSMYDFLNNKGINAKLLKQTIINSDNVKQEKQKNEIKIGLYKATRDPINNTYNQISACSLIEDVKLDIEPLNYEISSLAKMLNINISGASIASNIDNLLNKMKDNDVNLFVKLNEDCSILSLQSLEIGVPCVVGSNSIINGTELEKYITVANADNINDIYEKIKYVLENKGVIMKVYQEWKDKYIKEVEKCKNDFIII